MVPVEHVQLIAAASFAVKQIVDSRLDFTGTLAAVLFDIGRQAAVHGTQVVKCALDVFEVKQGLDVMVDFSVRTLLHQLFDTFTIKEEKPADPLGEDAINPLLR